MARWFEKRDGLRFCCTQCSHCCRHEPGYVFLSANDLERIEGFLGESREEVLSRYCVPVPFGNVRHVSLSEQRNHDCVFWEDGGCRIYPARPVQCRTYPFWEHVLTSEESWGAEARECPGIGVGPHISVSEITSMLVERQNHLTMLWPTESVS